MRVFLGTGRFYFCPLLLLRRYAVNLAVFNREAVLWVNDFVSLPIVLANGGRVVRAAVNRVVGITNRRRDSVRVEDGVFVIRPGREWFCPFQAGVFEAVVCQAGDHCRQAMDEEALIGVPRFLRGVARCVAEECVAIFCGRCTVAAVFRLSLFMVSARAIGRVLRLSLVVDHRSLYTVRHVLVHQGLLLPRRFGGRQRGVRSISR